MRALVISSVWFLSATVAAETVDALASMPSHERAATLAELRDDRGEIALPALLALQTGARQRVESRRDAGLPPQTPGCRTVDEFDLYAQLELARRSADGAQFVADWNRLRDKITALDADLDQARATSKWGRYFPAVRQWEREWQAAKDPRARELLWRTLRGQSIRAALLRPPGPLVTAGAKGQQHRVRRTASAGPSDEVYREYVFNLMCADDEDTLRWFKAQLAEIGWFDRKRFGWAADQAALLIVQHADADRSFQESAIEALWPRLAASETDPANFAFLVDRVAVRAGRPQSFGTQLECVGGEWIAPRIAEPDTLDARRQRMNLVSYDVQVARLPANCGD